MTQIVYLAIHIQDIRVQGVKVKTLQKSFFGKLFCFDQNQVTNISNTDQSLEIVKTETMQWWFQKSSTSVTDLDRARNKTFHNILCNDCLFLLPGVGGIAGEL